MSARVRLLAGFALLHAISGPASAAAPGAPTPPPVSAAFATIEAVPNPVAAGPGLGSTSVRWKSDPAHDASVYVSQDGGAEALFAKGSSGTAVANWIARGSIYEFRLYSNASPRALLARVTVRRSADAPPLVPPTAAGHRSPSLTASPNPVPAGFRLGRTEVSWDTGDGSPGRVTVSVDGSQETLFAAGARGSSRADWIDSGADYRFRLYRDGTAHDPVASVTVTRLGRSLAIAWAISAGSLVCLVVFVLLLAWRILRQRRQSELGKHHLLLTVPQAALVALTLHMVLYRLFFAHDIAIGMNTDVLSLLDWNDQYWVARVLGYGAKDLVVALGVYVIASIPGRFWRAPRGQTARGLGEAILVVGLAMIGLVSAAHVRMVMELRAGFDIPTVFDASAALAGDINDFVRWTDLALAASPVVLYGVLRTRWAPSGRWFGRPTLVTLALVATVGLLRTSKDSRLILDHPVIAVARQLTSSPDLGMSELQPLRVDARRRPGFIDPALARPSPVTAADRVCRPARRPRSLLLIVVEALAMRQVAAADGSVGPVMPQLASLATNGWWLRNHRTSANASPQAAFSIFTGFSSFPEVTLSITSSRFWMPAIWSRLRFEDRFLLTPATLNGFFPLGLVRRDGLQQVLDYDELRASATRPHPAGGLNELDGVDALVQRLQATSGKQFFGTYWSYGTHPPYFDADPPHRMIPAPGDDREQYLNAVRSFDNQLPRIMEALRQANHAEDTLVVIVSDHGQAFGEHGAWQHGRSAWEELLHVPALLWQPATLAPRVEERFTTHADLLPTILDLLGVAFDPLDFQGESLCATELRRRYIFATAREGAVISWNVTTRTKVVWDYFTGECKRFELSVDPGEHEALRCEDRGEQLAATKRFYLSERDILVDYTSSRQGRQAK
jgi:hypothetical protein